MSKAGVLKLSVKQQITPTKRRNYEHGALSGRGWIPAL